MQRKNHLRSTLPLAAGWLPLALAATALCAQTLPPMQPTTLAGHAAASPGTASPASNTPHRAEVLFNDGQLQVRADNSSLNQILRSISQRTGLKITGGIEDQRVFGNYGPGSMSTVLATLLDGAGANILLLGGDSSHPPELILTPVNGGPEPPGPNSPTYAMYDENTDREPPGAPPATLRSGEGIPQPPISPTKVSPPNPQPAALPSAVNSTSAPTRTLTPEMVEQELIKMQEQQNLKMKELDQKVRNEQLQNKNQPKQQNQSSQPPSGSPPQQ